MILFNPKHSSLFIIIFRTCSNDCPKFQSVSDYSIIYPVISVILLFALSFIRLIPSETRRVDGRSSWEKTDPERKLITTVLLWPVWSTGPGEGSLSLEIEIKLHIVFCGWVPQTKANNGLLPAAGRQICWWPTVKIVDHDRSVFSLFLSPSSVVVLIIMRRPAGGASETLQPRSKQIEVRQ